MKKVSGLSMRKRHILEGYSFVSLWVIGFIFFLAVPLGRSLYFSFNDLTISKERLKADFIGMDHFREAFTFDVNFVPALTATLSSMVIQVPLILIFSMFCALLLNKNFKGRALFRVIFFLPVIIASGAVLQKMLEQGAATLPIFVQYDLARILIDYVPAQVLLPLLKMMDSLTLIMWDAGVQILIFLAALQSVPQSLYDAAKCDGATAWESFWKITFPMIMPIVLVNILFSIVNTFTKIDNSVMQYINEVAFRKTDFGYAAALGWIYFILIFIIIGIVLLIFRERRDVSTKGGR